jgi:processive 1,2-diacylglycerol beta-glucosyltransferase
MRQKHSLDQNRFTILVSAGGFGVGPVGHLMEALARLAHPAHVVAVCGRNESLRAELTQTVERIANSSQVSFTLLGFTTEMDELMAAADLFVGKPGGLTTSEVLAKGLPMVVINPIPGQEERNSDHLLEHGAAIRSNNLPALAYKIDTLVDAPEKLARMAENARAMGKPAAAATIVERLVALCQPRASSCDALTRYATAQPSK